MRGNCSCGYRVPDRPRRRPRSRGIRDDGRRRSAHRPAGGSTNRQRPSRCVRHSGRVVVRFHRGLPDHRDDAYPGRGRAAQPLAAGDGQYLSLAGRALARRRPGRRADAREAPRQPQSEAREPAHDPMGRNGGRPELPAADRPATTPGAHRCAHRTLGRQRHGGGVRRCGAGRRSEFPRVPRRRTEDGRREVPGARGAVQGSLR